MRRFAVPLLSMTLLSMTLLAVSCGGGAAHTHGPGPAPEPVAGGPDAGSTATADVTDPGGADATSAAAAGPVVIAGVTITEQNRGAWLFRVPAGSAGGEEGEESDVDMDGAVDGRMYRGGGSGGGGPARAELGLMADAPITTSRRGSSRRPPRTSPSPDPAPTSLAEPPEEPVYHSTGPAASPLRAGSTDDNADFTAFLAFLEQWTDNGDVKRFSRPIAVQDRRFLKVVDRAGRPVPAARVQIIDEEADRIVWEGTTYGDGRVPYYPVVAGAKQSPTGGFLIQASRGAANAQKRWDGSGETVEIALPMSAKVSDPIPLDVLFIIDTTGSMADEIDRIKATLLATTQRLRELDREFDLRYGAILYRDIYDDYVTASHPFTGDIEAFDAALKAVHAGGGGDTPESLNQGVAEAVHRMRWRDGVAKVAFLIADAPPHMDYEGDTPYTASVRDAVAQGIRIHSVAASGLSGGGTVVFRQILE